jgi:predicted nucleotidyltransferase
VIGAGCFGSSRRLHLEPNAPGAACKSSRGRFCYTGIVAEDVEQLSALIYAALVGRAEVLDAYLFGSVARGQAPPHSDVDIAVYVEPVTASQPGFGIGADITSDLSQALGGDDVDVVILNDAPRLLYRSALKDGVRILARDLRATTTREGRAVEILRLRAAAR